MFRAITGWDIPGLTKVFELSDETRHLSVYKHTKKELITI